MFYLLRRWSYVSLITGSFIAMNTLKYIIYLKMKTIGRCMNSNLENIETKSSNQLVLSNSVDSFGLKYWSTFIK